ncbi:MAG: flippase-like domain-containing protein, partial [Acidobacteria bacterium]|nr:flippase-like domain-containing protein [Acidobacteriota bacterium]
GASAGGGALAALVVLFVLAGDPERLGRTMARLGQVVPSALAGLIARIAEKFARGLGAMRRPGPLCVALAWSFPLWLSIAAGIWAVAMAFRLAVPFTGSFLLIALLSLGVAVPTPGAIGGFHEAFRIGATTFFGAPDAAAVGAAIVLHAFSIGPALLLGVLFAAQEGLNLGSVQQLASQAELGTRRSVT